MSGIIKLKIMVLIMLAVCGCFLFAGGSQEKTTGYNGEQGRITVYLSGPADMLNKLETEFEKDNGDVLDFVQMGCGPLRQRVWAEMEAGGIKADVFWGSDPLLYNALAGKGALENYKPAGIDALKPEFQTEGSFTMVNERYGVVIYNNEKVNLPPVSFSDLLDERFANVVCHADPAQSSTALALISGLWELSGSGGDYYKKLSENGLYLTRKNSDVPSKIQEGEFDAGIAPHDAVLRLRKKAKKDGYPMSLEIAWPTEGAVAIQRPIAISRNDDRPEINSEIAHNFVDFMISMPAQKITSQFGFVSVREDLTLPSGVPENLKTRNINWSELAAEQNIINDNFKKFFK